MAVQLLAEACFPLFIDLGEVDSHLRGQGLALHSVGPHRRPFRLHLFGNAGEPDGEPQVGSDAQGLFGTGEDALFPEVVDHAPVVSGSTDPSLAAISGSAGYVGACTAEACHGGINSASLWEIVIKKGAGSGGASAASATDFSARVAHSDEERGHAK